MLRELCENSSSLVEVFRKTEESECFHSWCRREFSLSWCCAVFIGENALSDNDDFTGKLRSESAERFSKTWRKDKTFISNGFVVLSKYLWHGTTLLFAVDFYCFTISHKSSNANTKIPKILITRAISTVPWRWGRQIKVHRLFSVF